MENHKPNSNGKYFKYSVLTVVAILLFQELLLCQTIPADSRSLKRDGTEFIFRRDIPVLFLPSYIPAIKPDATEPDAGNSFPISKFIAGLSDTLFQSVPGPLGGTVRNIAVDQEGWLFAGTDGGVYKSTDNGAHWKTNLFPTQLFNFVEPVTILGPNVVVAETDFYNFISRDGGKSWSYLPENTQGFAVDTNGGIYAGSDYSGVKISTDTADTWSIFALAGEKIYKVVLCGGGQIVCPSDSGMYFSSDSGMTWIYRKYNGTYNKSLISDRNGHLFAITGSRIYRSSDFGNSWTQLFLPNMNQGESLYRIYAGEGNHLFTVTYRRILISTDAGETWDSIEGPFESPLTAGEDSQGNLLVGSFEGILRRNEVNGEWEELNSGIHGRRIEEITFTSAGSILVLSLGLCFRSTDDGNSWSKVHFDSTIYTFYYGAMRSLSSGSIFMTAYFDGKPGLLRSDDDGISWEKISILSNQSSISAITEGLPGEILAATYHGDIYRSTDGGDSWSQVVTSTASSEITCIASDEEGNHYAAKDSAVLISHNGTDWEEISLARNHSSWESMVVDKRGDVFLGSSGGGVFHSSNHGETWSLMNQGLYDRYVMSMTADDSGNVFVGTSEGIFQLADSVDKWVWFSTGFPKTFTTSLESSPQGFLFAGTQDYGMYRSLTPMKRRIPVPEPPPPPPVYNFRLRQNYPNPFNNQTLIRYGVPLSARVEIKIYNILGQLVTTLISDNLEAGNYSVEWTPTRAASGLYFCKMTARTLTRHYEKTIKVLYVR